MKHDSKDDLHSINLGGSFHFRAEGEHKEYGPDIDEFHTLRSFGGATAHVFNSVFEKFPKAEIESLSSVREINENKLSEIFNIFISFKVVFWRMV